MAASICINREVVLQGRGILIGLALALAGCVSTKQLASPNQSQPSHLWPQQLQSADGFILGEIHGTREYPAAFLELVNAGPKPMLVGLELNDDDAKLPCKAEGAWPVSWVAKEQDGRRSQAMFDLICSLQELESSGAVNLVYFDNRSIDNPSFYANARDLISKNMSTGNYAKFAILSGNFHSLNDTGKLARMLENSGLSVVTATGSAPRGTAWVCTKDGCGPKDFGSAFCRPPEDRSVAASWVFSGEEAAKGIGSKWDACLTLPSISASPPAAGQ